MNLIKKYSMKIRETIILFTILSIILFGFYSLYKYSNSLLNDMFIRGDNMEMNYTTSVIVDKEVKTKNRSLFSGGIFGSGPYSEYSVTSQLPDDTKQTFNLNDQSQFESLVIGDTIYIVYNASGKLTAIRKSKDDLDEYIETVLTYYDDSNLEPVIQEIQY